MANYSNRYYKNLYRQNNTPRTSLAYADEALASFTPIVYTPEKEDMSLLQRSLATLDERKEKTDQQRATILSAIGNLKLNEAEDKWKLDYANRISSRIDAASQFGDYSGALEEATRMAGEALSSPEVTGRLRYQENREKWLSNLESRRARNEIDSETYARAKEENKYAYRDTYDDNRTIIGGTDWKASFEPVNDLNLSQVFNEIKSFITPSSKASSSSGGTTQTYVDAKGNITTNASEAKAVFSTVKGGGSGYSETGVTEQQWEEAYNAWLNAHPEAAQALEQKRQNDIWRYKQYFNKEHDMSLSEEERTDAKKNKDVRLNLLTDKDGGLLSPENYAKYRAAPMLKAMAFKKTSSSNEGGSTLLDTDYLKRKTIGEAYNLTIGEVDLWSLGSPEEREAILKNAASNRNSVDSAARDAESSLSNSFGSSRWKYPRWN